MRIEITSLSGLSDWLTDVANPLKYDLYWVVDDQCTVAVKNVSTSPRIHAVVEDTVPAEAKSLAEKHGMNFTTVDSFEWGIHYPESEDV